MSFQAGRVHGYRAQFISAQGSWISRHVNHAHIRHTRVVYIIERFILGDPLGLNFSGTAILAVFNLFLIGIELICLGLIALYIGNINTEVTNRPLYVVRKKKI